VSQAPDDRNQRDSIEVNIGISKARLKETRWKKKKVKATKVQG
jgi:hypothetical protein